MLTFWQSDLVLWLQYSCNYTHKVDTFWVVCQRSELWLQTRATSRKQWSEKQVFWLICFECLNDEISRMLQSNRVPASATAVHLVHPLTGNHLECWEPDVCSSQLYDVCLAFQTAWWTGGRWGCVSLSSSLVCLPSTTRPLSWSSRIFSTEVGLCLNLTDTALHVANIDVRNE